MSDVTTKLGMALIVVALLAFWATVLSWLT